MLTEPHQEALSSYMKLVLDQVEIVGLLADIVWGVNRVCDLEPSAILTIEQAKVCHILVLSKLAILVNAEVLRWILFTID